MPELREQSSQPTAETSRGRAIVVGGGIAGIAAALALARCGVQVTLVEAKRRLGGRAASFVDPHSGETIDYCQHVGMGCCTNLRQLIDWLGQSDQWRVHKELHFYAADRKHRRLGAIGWLPAPFHLAGWLWSWPGLNWSDRVCIARGMRALDRLALVDELDRQSAFDWLGKQRQTPAAIDRFWGTVIVSALGEELKRVSLWAVAKVFQDGFLRHRDAFHLLVPQKPLSNLFGSEAETLLRSMRVKVELASAVEKLIWFDGKCRGVRLADQREISGDATILAIPWHRYGIFKDDPSKRELATVVESAQRLASSPISGVHTWWDRNWLPTDHAVLVGRLCQWVFPKPDQTSENDAGEYYYQIVVSASREFSTYLPRAEKASIAGQAWTTDSRATSDRDSQYLLHAIHADLAGVFTEAAKAKLLRVKSITDPLAVFSVEPGVGAFRPSVDSVGHGLWLAGDWTKTQWPATMEGAALSGFRAAEFAAKSLGLAHSFVAKPLAGS